MAFFKSKTFKDGVLHVRFTGRSLDVALNQLGIPLGASDAAVKRALAGYLEIHESGLRDYVVDRHVNGNVTVRPEAVFG